MTPFPDLPRHHIGQQGSHQRRRRRNDSVLDPVERSLFQNLKAHTAAVRGITLSPDGMKLATASWNRTVKIWAGGNGTGRVEQAEVEVERNSDSRKWVLHLPFQRLPERPFRTLPGGILREILSCPHYSLYWGLFTQQSTGHES